mgnify:CR=1 FL=1
MTDNSTSGTIKVEVAYARPDKQLILTVQVSQGTTALQAAEQSGIVAKFPEIDLPAAKLGIFGKSIKPNTSLREGDRVEIYRALIADPKQARRDRAAATK